MENYQYYKIKDIKNLNSSHVRVANEEDDNIDLCKINLSRGLFENLGMKRASFKDCRITQTIIRDCYFREAEFINVDFTGSKFIGCNLERAKFKSCNFRYVTFTQSKINIEEIMGSLPTEPNLLKEVLRELRRNEEGMGERKSADRILLKEFIAERKLYAQQILAETSYYKENSDFFTRLKAAYRYAKSLAGDLLWGHGLNIINLLRSGLILIFIFAYLFYSMQEVYKFGEEIIILDFEKSIYLSALSFSTLGYGEYIPQTPISKLLICIENFFGGIFIGLFAAAVYRKIAR